MDSTTEKNLTLLRTAYETLERGDLDACVEMLTEDFIANVPGLPDPLYGRKSGGWGRRPCWTDSPT